MISMLLNSLKISSNLCLVEIKGMFWMGFRRLMTRQEIFLTVSTAVFVFVAANTVITFIFLSILLV